MFEEVRIQRELGEVREKGVDVWLDRDAMFPNWFTRSTKGPTMVMRDHGLVVPHQIPATVWAWLNTTSARRLGYVGYQQPTPLGPLPMFHLVPEAMMKRRYPNGEEPY